MREVLEKEDDYKERYIETNTMKTKITWKPLWERNDGRAERKDDIQRPRVQTENFVNLKELTRLTMSYTNSIRRSSITDVFGSLDPQIQKRWRMPKNLSCASYPKNTVIWLKTITTSRWKWKKRYIEETCRRILNESKWQLMPSFFPLTFSMSHSLGCK